MALDVLLLEDDPAKKNRLLEFLHNHKDIFSRVDPAICTAGAIRLMKERQYDLLVADVVVPAELGGEISEENCISMFEQIDDGYGDVKCPTYALPISASGEITQAAHDFFRGRPWGILSYTEGNNECLATIEKVARFVLNEKERDLDSARCDIFIITALMDPEFVAIETLGLNWGPLEPLDGSQLVRFGDIKIGGDEYTVAAGFSARMGPVAASILAVKAILKLRPRLVIMAGICAGIPGKAGIGDVIATEISWDWQSGKYIDKSGVEAFEIAPHQLGLDDKCRNQILLLKRDVKFWDSLAPLAVREKTELPKLILGPMASGASVLADERVAERIKTNQHKNVVGLDMETYAVFAAVNACATGVRAVSLKAVCDNGDRKKNDNYQQYAATVSAATVHEFITKYAGPLLVT